MAAQSSVASLYATLAGASGAVPIAAELGGLTITPGTYSFASTANIAATTTLTLSGAGTYIFKVGSAITANVGSNVVLINGASACNVFWQITSAATLNGVTFAGTVVAQAAVTLGTGAVLTGRALTTAAGDVTMAGGNTVGGCSDPSGGCPTISLAPATLPGGTVGVAYSQTITGSGGAAPYTFDVTAGTLPTGLGLTSAGALTGAPTTAGTFTFTIRGTDANGCLATLAYTIIIAAPPPVPPVCPTLTLSPTTLPDGITGNAYQETIVASGGTAPYAFGMTGGALPSGMTLLASGVVSGIPTMAGQSIGTVRATATGGCFVERVFALSILNAVPTLPQIVIVLLACALITIGYSRLRRRPH